jgi:DMSO/TMAO reductase YedYZ molybdopterin-dependent catalytic subunit
VRHVCIEGWSAIGSFGGVRMADFLTMVGASATAGYVEVACLDDYYTSYDMVSCRHPQTLLCDQMYGRPLDRGHGAPLRVHMPTKLGYKSAKGLFSLKVTSRPPRQRGFYPWHGGL